MQAGIGAVDALEQGGGDGVLFQDDFRRVLLNQFLEFGRIADINQAEVVFGIGAFKPSSPGLPLISHKCRPPLAGVWKRR